MIASYDDPLNLVERDVVGGAIAELGRPRRLVGGDRLGLPLLGLDWFKKLADLSEQRLCGRLV